MSKLGEMSYYFSKGKSEDKAKAIVLCVFFPPSVPAIRSF